MKQSIKTLLHLAFWLGYLLLMAIVLFAARQGNDIPPEDQGYFASFIIGIGIIPPTASFYAHYHLLFPRYLQHRRILASILASVCISAVAMLLGFLFVKLTSEEAFGCIETGLPYAIPFTFGLATLVGVIALILKGFLTWYDELRLKEALMEKTHRMELALVKSQLDPHFLFNTINNIDVLITKDPEKLPSTSTSGPISYASCCTKLKPRRSPWPRSWRTSRSSLSCKKSGRPTSITSATS